MTSNRSSSRLIDFGMIFGYVRRTVWLPTLIFLGLFFAMPVALALKIQTAVAGVNIQWEALALYAFEGNNALVKFIIVVSAIVCGLVVFAFIHSQKKVDFYHSLPISRSKLFVNNYLAGVCNLLVPYLAAVLLSLAVLVGNGMVGYMDWGTFFAGLGIHLLGYLSIYGFVVLAAVITGNVVVNFLVTGVLLGIGPALIAMYVWVMETFYENFYAAIFNSDKLLTYVSPFLNYVVIDSYSYPLDWSNALILFVFAAVGFGLSLFLYKKRPSEKAGSAIAFKYAKPLLKYPVIAICAIGLGIMLYEVSGIDNGNFWLYFGFVFGGVIASRIIEIIYAFDFKAIKKNWVSLAVFAAIFACIMAVPISDLTKYDAYQPKADEVAKVEIKLETLNSFAENKSYNFNYHYYGNDEKSNFIAFTEEADIVKALALTEKAVQMTESPDEDIYYNYMEYDYKGNRNENTSIGVIYTLANGNKVNRYYNYRPKDILMAEISTLVDTNAYKSQIYNDLNKNIEEVVIGNITAFEGSSAENNFNLKSLNLIARQKLFNIYKEELLELNSDEMKNTMPIGTIQFDFMLSPNDPMIKGWNIVLEKDQSFSYTVYYPIYESFKNTMKELQALGLDRKVFAVNTDNIISIDITDYTKYNKDMQQKEKAMVEQTINGSVSVTVDSIAVAPEVKTIRDKAKIAEILSQSYTEQAYEYNSFIQPNESMHINVNYISDYSDYGATSRYFPLED